MNRKAALMLVVILLAMFSGCMKAEKTKESANEVKIGTVWPLSGALASSGEKHLNGVKLRVDEVNNAGGIKSLGGAKIKLIVADNQGDPKVSASETGRLIVKDKIVGLIGCYTSATTLPATEVTERYKIPAVVCAGSPKITGRGYKYVFRAHSEVIKTADISVKFLKDVVKAKSVAIIMENSAYGQASAKCCEKAAKDAGMEIVLKELFPSGTKDLTPILLKVKEAKPDAILAVGYVSDAILMVKQMRELDVNVKALIAPGGAGFNDADFLKAAKEDAEYVLIGIFWSPDAKRPGNAEFVAHYKEVFGEDPDPLAAEAYEATTVLLDAIERAGSTDPEKIREALTKTNMTWISGPIQFDERGENIYKNVVVVQVQNGTFVTVYPEEVAVAKPIVPMTPWTER